MREKRVQPRANVSLEVELVKENQEITSHRTKNIGLGGMFIDSSGQELPEVGKEVELRFAGDSPYVMKARVSRVSENGIALIFVDFKFEDFMFLETPLKKQQPSELSVRYH